MPQKTNRTHIKWERALRLIVQLDLTKKIGGIFLQTALERGANGSLQFTEITGLQSAKGGFVVIILCQYAEFRCKTMPIYFVLLHIYLNNSSIQYLSVHILYYWMFFNKH